MAVSLLLLFSVARLQLVKVIFHTNHKTDYMVNQLTSLKLLQMGTPGIHVSLCNGRWLPLVVHDQLNRADKFVKKIIPIRNVK